jgi:hypothetical protein
VTTLFDHHSIHTTDRGGSPAVLELHYSKNGYGVFDRALDRWTTVVHTTTRTDPHTNHELARIAAGIARTNATPAKEDT